MCNKKFTILTLGCAKNLVDSEIIAGTLEKKGLKFTYILEDADLIIVNTCGFITPATIESIDTILEISKIKSNREIKIAVCGCLSERYKEKLIKELPEVDFFAGVNDLEKIYEIIGGEIKPFSKTPYIYNFKTPRRDISPPHIKYVKIGEGCSHRCSFCVIPQIKGEYRSREIKDIYREIKEAVEKGKKEIVLISQDCGFYGLDIYKKPSLGTLLKKIDEIEGEFWIRVFYINPFYFKPSLVDIIKNSRHIVPYFDIPFQHVSEKILKNMNRSGDDKRFLEIIESIRSKIPEATIRSSFIVGFPGEEESDFIMLKNFLIEAKLEFAGFFPYFDEEGAKSHKLKEKVKDKVKEERIKILENIQRGIMKKIYREKYKNRVFKVIVDGYKNESEFLIEARTQFQGPEIDNVVFLTGGDIEKLEIGKFFNVRIKRYLYPHLEGVVL